MFSKMIPFPLGVLNIFQLATINVWRLLVGDEGIDDSPLKIFVIPACFLAGIQVLLDGKPGPRPKDCRGDGLSSFQNSLMVGVIDMTTVERLKLVFFQLNNFPNKGIFLKIGTPLTISFLRD